MKTSIPDAEWRDPYTNMTLREMDERVKARRDGMLREALGVAAPKIPNMIATKDSSLKAVYYLYSAAGFTPPKVVDIALRNHTFYRMENMGSRFRAKVDAYDETLRSDIEKFLNETMMYQPVFWHSWECIVDGVQAMQCFRSPTSVSPAQS